MRQQVFHPFNQTNIFYNEFLRKKPREVEEAAPLDPEAATYLEPFAVKDSGLSPASQTHEDTINRLLKDEFHMLESPQDKEKKADALIKLDAILRLWMKKVHAELKIVVDEADPASKNHYARLLCYGSYKLGVSGPDGDIDALVLAPNYVNRDKHFFGTLYDLLKELSGKNEDIRDLVFVNDKHAITPLINMRFQDIDVDLVFATLERVDMLDGRVDKLGLSERPNLNNDDLLREMDEKMKRSYNGFRNAEMMLAAVVRNVDRSQPGQPDRAVASFRSALRSVKLMCKRQGIAENKVGFLGGIAFALLTVKIVQLFPSYSLPYLLERFLYVYGFVWNWDAWKVTIVPEIVATNVRDFRGENFQDKRSMYIMTPAYPQMNSCHNVTFSTRETILSAFRSLHAKVLSALAIKATSELEAGWKNLFKRFDFFGAYEQYLEIVITGNEADLFNSWRGFVESKVRLLTEGLERLAFHFDFAMQLWPQTFLFDEVTVARKYSPELLAYSFKEKIYIGVSMRTETEAPLDLNATVAGFVSQIESKWGHERGCDPALINLYVHLVEKDWFESPHAQAPPPEVPALARRFSHKQDSEVLDENSEDDGDMLKDLLD